MISESTLIYENLKTYNFLIDKNESNENYYYEKYENNKDFVYFCKIKNKKNIQKFLEEKIFLKNSNYNELNSPYLKEIKKKNIRAYSYPNFNKINFIYENNNFYLKENDLKSFHPEENIFTCFIIFVNKHVYSERRNKIKSKL